MSAFDISGAVVSGILAFMFWCAAVIPNKPPKPRYGDVEAKSFLVAIPMTAWFVFCVTRLSGAGL